MKTVLLMSDYLPTLRTLRNTWSEKVKGDQPGARLADTRPQGRQQEPSEGRAGWLCAEVGGHVGHGSRTQLSRQRWCAGAAVAAAPAEHGWSQGPPGPLWQARWSPISKGENRNRM